MRASRLVTAAAFLILVVRGAADADPLAVTPFYTFNQSPVVQIYGLPAAESSVIQPPGRAWGILTLDVANSFLSREEGEEGIVIDGESYRTTLALRYGIANRLEIGFDLPLVGYSGGVFDGFIEEWHRFFALPQGNRTGSPEGRLLFQYTRGEEEQLRVDRSSFGIGDLRLGAGWQLYDDGKANRAAVALRGSLKLPTGESAHLAGSGSTDLALWLTGSKDYLLPGSWGHATLFLALGGMATTDGDVLKEQRRNQVGFGTLGFGWSPADFIALKTQFSAHTAFYRGSGFSELTSPAVQWLFGGTYAFTPFTTLDIALSEDASIGASPDVALHLGLGHHF